MDTKKDDLSGQEISISDAWKVKVTNPATKLSLDIDTKYEDQLKNMVSLAVGNGQRWYKWQKDANGKLNKIFPDELGGM